MLYLIAWPGVQNVVMLLNALCFLIGPKIDVRILEENSSFGIKQTCTITRTLGEEGGVTWEEKTVEGKDWFWIHKFQYGPQGEFISQVDETARGGKSDLFKVGVEENRIVARMVKYGGETMDSSLKYKGATDVFADSSRLWWSAAKPSLGDQVKSMTYLQMFGFYELTVVYVSDETISVNGKSYDVHKLERKIEGMRNETWWVDDNGLVVKRIFWTRDANDPHRVDLIKT